jgi:hypothetical protein
VWKKACPASAGFSMAWKNRGKIFHAVENVEAVPGRAGKG